MTTLADWARTWGVPDAALRDLQARLGALDRFTSTDTPAPRSEAAVQTGARVRASQLGWRLWRNNVGAIHDAKRNIHVRFGLANDSPQVNAVVKSGDLIGIRPRIIQPDDIGTLIGQFVSIECKRADWTYSGDEHETAQLNWANLVVSLGGDARFVTNEGNL